MMMNKVNRNSK